VALAHCGRVDRAREVLRQLLAIEPGLTIRAWRASVGLADEAYIGIYQDGLRLAGLPE
jgi:hypothetical protein